MQHSIGARYDARQSRVRFFASASARDARTDSNPNQIRKWESAGLGDSREIADCLPEGDEFEPSVPIVHSLR
jgi:hypothetical protein